MAYLGLLNFRPKMAYLFNFDLFTFLRRVVNAAHFTFTLRSRDSGISAMHPITMDWIQLTTDEDWVMGDTSNSRTPALIYVKHSDVTRAHGPRDQGRIA